MDFLRAKQSTDSMDCESPFDDLDRVIEQLPGPEGDGVSINAVLEFTRSNGTKIFGMAIGVGESREKRAVTQRSGASKQEMAATNVRPFYLNASFDSCVATATMGIVKDRKAHARSMRRLCKKFGVVGDFARRIVFSDLSGGARKKREHRASGKKKGKSQKTKKRGGDRRSQKSGEAPTNEEVDEESDEEDFDEDSPLPVVEFWESAESKAASAEKTKSPKRKSKGGSPRQESAVSPSKKPKHVKKPKKTPSPSSEASEQSSPPQDVEPMEEELEEVKTADPPFSARPRRSGVSERVIEPINKMPVLPRTSRDAKSLEVTPKPTKRTSTGIGSTLFSQQPEVKKSKPKHDQPTKEDLIARRASEIAAAKLIKEENRRSSMKPTIRYISSQSISDKSNDAEDDKTKDDDPPVPVIAPTPKKPTIRYISSPSISDKSNDAEDDKTKDDEPPVPVIAPTSKKPTIRYISSPSISDKSNDAEDDKTKDDNPRVPIIETPKADDSITIEVDRPAVTEKPKRRSGRPKRKPKRGGGRPKGSLNKKPSDRLSESIASTVEAEEPGPPSPKKPKLSKSKLRASQVEPKKPDAKDDDSSDSSDPSDPSDDDKEVDPRVTDPFVSAKWVLSNGNKEEQFAYKFHHDLYLFKSEVPLNNSTNHIPASCVIFSCLQIIACSELSIALIHPQFIPDYYAQCDVRINLKTLDPSEYLIVWPAKPELLIIPILHNRHYSLAIFARKEEKNFVFFVDSAGMGEADPENEGLNTNFTQHFDMLQFIWRRVFEPNAKRKLRSQTTLIDMTSESTTQTDGFNCGPHFCVNVDSFERCYLKQGLTPDFVFSDFFTKEDAHGNIMRNALVGTLRATFVDVDEKDWPADCPIEDATVDEPSPTTPDLDDEMMEIDQETPVVDSIAEGLVDLSVETDVEPDVDYERNVEPNVNRVVDVEPDNEDYSMYGDERALHHNAELSKWILPPRYFFGDRFEELANPQVSLSAAAYLTLENKMVFEIANRRIYRGRFDVMQLNTSVLMCKILSLIVADRSQQVGLVSADFFDIVGPSPAYPPAKAMITRKEINKKVLVPIHWINHFMLAIFSYNEEEQTVSVRYVDSMCLEFKVNIKNKLLELLAYLYPMHTTRIVWIGLTDYDEQVGEGKNCGAFVATNAELDLNSRIHRTGRNGWFKRFQLYDEFCLLFNLPTLPQLEEPAFYRELGQPREEQGFLNNHTFFDRTRLNMPAPQQNDGAPIYVAPRRVHWKPTKTTIAPPTDPTSSPKETIAEEPLPDEAIDEEDFDRMTARVWDDDRIPVSFADDLLGDDEESRDKSIVESASATQATDLDWSGTIATQPINRKFDTIKKRVVPYGKVYRTTRLGPRPIHVTLKRKPAKKQPRGRPNFYRAASYERGMRPQEYNIGHMNKECPYCGAYRFPKETFDKCCKNGRVKMPDLHPYMQFHRNLIHQSREYTSEFTKKQMGMNTFYRKYIRMMNTLLAFGTISFNTKDSGVKGAPVQLVNGSIDYNLCNIEAKDGNYLKFGQLFTVDHTNDAMAALRQNPLYKKIENPAYKNEILEWFHQYMQVNNSIAQGNRSCFEAIQDLRKKTSVKYPRYKVNYCSKSKVPENLIKTTKHMHDRQVNEPEAEEVAVVFQRVEGGLNIPEFSNGLWMDSRNNAQQYVHFPISDIVDPIMNPTVLPTGQQLYSLQCPLRTTAEAEKERNPEVHLGDETSSSEEESEEEDEEKNEEDVESARAVAEAELLDFNDDLQDKELMEENEFNANEPVKKARVRKYASVREQMLYRSQFRKADYHVHPIWHNLIVGQLLIIKNYFEVVRNEVNFYDKFVSKRFVEDKYIREHRQRLLEKQITGAKLGKVKSFPRLHPESWQAQRKAYQKGMVFAQKKGAPTFLITITANQNWPEVVAACKMVGIENKADAPNILIRAFNLRLQKLMNEIIGKGKSKKDKGKGIFGRCSAYILSKEFQKRGNIHAHLVIWIDDKDKELTPAFVNNYVRAQIPSPKDKEYFNAVKSFMIHSCNEDSVCHSDPNNKAKCMRHYPMTPSLNTYITQGHIRYRRLPEDLSRKIYDTERNKIFTDRDVVPHNAYLLLRWGGHANIEAIVTDGAPGYTIKYVLKGGSAVFVEVIKLQEAEDLEEEEEKSGTDDASKKTTSKPKLKKPKLKHGKKHYVTKNAKGEYDVDEAKRYFELTYISVQEAYTKLEHSRMFYFSGPVEEIPIHLPMDEIMMIGDDDKIEKIVRKVDWRDGIDVHSRLTAYFQFCATHPEEAKEFTYCGLNENYRYDSKTMEYTKLQPNAKKPMVVICRTNIKRGNLLALRTILLMRPCLTSFKHAATDNDGVVHYDENGDYDFVKAACAMGYMESDLIWRNAMDQSIGYPIRQVILSFAQCLTEGAGHNPDPVALWNAYKQYMMPNLGHKLADENLTDDQLTKLSEQITLSILDFHLAQHNLTRLNFHLPAKLTREELPPNIAFVEYNPEDFGEEAENYLYADFVPITKEPIKRVELLHEQLTAFNTIKQATENAVNEISNLFPRMFFLHGMAGSGKSVLLNQLRRYCIRHNIEVSSTAMTGVAASLLDGGQTFHSRFHMPNVCKGIKPLIEMHGAWAERIRRTGMLFVDEASQMNIDHYTFLKEALLMVRKGEEVQRRLVVIFTGDYRQMLPITGPGFNPYDSSLMPLGLTGEITFIKLLRSLRLDTGQEVLGSFLQDVGLGRKMIHRIGQPDKIKLIPGIQLPRTEEELLAAVYPEDDRASWNTSVIATPLNVHVNMYNDIMMGKIKGKEFVYEAINTPDLTNFDPLGTHAIDAMHEVMAHINGTGLGWQKLKIKEGAKVIVVKNVDVRFRLCNGTPAIVKKCHPDLIVLNRINYDGSLGAEFLLTRARFVHEPEFGTGRTLQFERVQFPIKAGYAMTNHKVQGQTVPRIGVALNTPVFGHGNLYVALSRVTKVSDLFIYNPTGPNEPADEVINVVDRRATDFVEALERGDHPTVDPTQESDDNYDGGSDDDGSSDDDGNDDDGMDKPPAMDKASAMDKIPEMDDEQIADYFGEEASIDEFHGFPDVDNDMNDDFLAFTNVGVDMNDDFVGFETAGEHMNDDFVGFETAGEHMTTDANDDEDEPMEHYEEQVLPTDSHEDPVEEETIQEKPSVVAEAFGFSAIAEAEMAEEDPYELDYDYSEAESDDGLDDEMDVAPTEELHEEPIQPEATIEDDPMPIAASLDQPTSVVGTPTQLTQSKFLIFSPNLGVTTKFVSDFSGPSASTQMTPQKVAADEPRQTTPPGTSAPPSQEKVTKRGVSQITWLPGTPKPTPAQILAMLAAKPRLISGPKTSQQPEPKAESEAELEPESEAESTSMFESESEPEPEPQPERGR